MLVRQLGFSRAGNACIGLAGLVLGFYFSSNVVMSDGTRGREAQSVLLGSVSVAKVPVSAAARVNLLQTAQAIGLPIGSPRPGSISDLDPATIAMLRALEPAARGMAVPEGSSKNETSTALPVQVVYKLHLASVAEETQVSTIIDQLKRQSREAFDNATFRAVSAGEDGQAKRFTRILAGTYASAQEAQQSCDRLKAGGQYCAVLRFNP